MDLEEETSPGSPTILNSLRDTQSKKVLRRAAIALAINAMLQRTLPAGFIAPCLPTKTDKLPSGSEFRSIALAIAAMTKPFFLIAHLRCSPAAGLGLLQEK